MTNELATAIALATAWLKEDLGAWQYLAQGAARETQPKCSVSSAKWWCDWPRPTQPQSLGDTPEAVVQHLALDAEQGEVTTDVMGGCAPIM